MVRKLTIALALALAAPVVHCNFADEPADPSILTLERIFQGQEFKTKSFGPYEWLDDGAAYTTLEDTEQPERVEAQDREDPADQDSGDIEVDEVEETAEEEDAPSPPKELVRYDTRTGARSVLVTAGQLTPAGREEPLDVAAYKWSDDKSKLLIFTNTVKVWRRNTRGDYWVLDMETRTLRKLGAGGKPSTLMFAKFSPSADRVAYVRENNIYVESLETGDTVSLTTNGTRTLINGTFDWVYEEELDLRDGFRWSPDGRQIAYWQLDSTGIQDFYIVNNTAGLYPRLTPFPYPKVGTTNSAGRIGVVSATGGDTTWMQIPGDPRDNYLAELEWVVDGKQLLIQQLNRLQNKRILWQTDASTGQAVNRFIDEDDAWVDMRHRFPWYKSNSHRLILSETDGWRHVYQVSLADGSTRLLSPGDYDVIDLVGMAASDDDDGSGWLYLTASPDSAVETYLYRVPLGGGPRERITPPGAVGTHSYDVAPNGKWAMHTFSALYRPPVTELVALPTHETVRVPEDNAAVQEKLEQLRLGELEYFRVTIEDQTGVAGPGEEIELDACLIKPPDFDPSKKYPILFYVYTEPWGQTTRNVWGRNRNLWHLMLSQQGYLIATVDNRGTPAPRGRAWRKAIHGKIGIVNVHDQAAATRQILEMEFVDASRVGVWGWSGGGSATLNAMFQHPDLYHVGMSVAPVGDLKLYDTIYEERYMGLPSENKEGYEQGSPVTHARHLKGKLLLVHGTGDDNVHYQNAEVVINELIKHNRPFDMMAYPNRSHSISEGQHTTLHLFQLLTRYLNTHLPAGPR